jgi:hypothetical protein
MRTAPFADRLDTVEGRIHALRRAAPVVAALLPHQWSDRASMLSQQLDVSYGLALNEILDAHTAWSNDPNGQARTYAAEHLAPPRRPGPQHPFDPTTRWAGIADRISPDLTKDRDWATLAEHISRAGDSGFHVDTRLPLLVAARPLDPAHRARDLDFRLIDACPDCLSQPDPAIANDNRESTAAVARRRLATADLQHTIQHTNAAVRADEPTTPSLRRPTDRVPATTPIPRPNRLTRGSTAPTTAALDPHPRGQRTQATLRRGTLAPNPTDRADSPRCKVERGLSCAPPHTSPRGTRLLGSSRALVDLRAVELLDRLLELAVIEDAFEEGVVLVHASNDRLEEVAVEYELEVLDRVITGLVGHLWVRQPVPLVLVEEKLVGLRQL